MDSLSDLAPAPDASRGWRKVLFSRWTMVTMGLFALLVFAGLWSHRPLARIPFPGGGELWLVEARYSPTVHYEGHIRFADRLRHLLPSRRNTPLAKAGVLDLGQPGQSPHLWLILEGHGVAARYFDLPDINGVAVMESGLMVGSGGRYSLGSGKTSKPCIIAELACYPRRARQLQVRIKMDDRLIETTVPNPFPMTVAPLWTPEPMPQSRKLQSREIVLHSLHRESAPEKTTELVPGVVDTQAASLIIRPEIEVREAGVPSGAFDTSRIFSDSTGNVDNVHLPSGESVWKVHAIMWPNTAYPFPMSEVVSLGRTTMPGPGEIRVLPLPVPDGAPGCMGHHAVLVGRGRYRRKPGSEPNFESLEVVGKHQFDRPVDSNGEIILDWPELLLIGQGPARGNVPDPGSHRLARAVAASGTVPMGEHWEHSNGTDWMEGDRFFDKQAEGPPQGTELEIQLILVQEQSVDFFVRPPP